MLTSARHPAGVAGRLLRGLRLGLEGRQPGTADFQQVVGFLEQIRYCRIAFATRLRRRQGAG
jgi:hypothetical protein